MEMNSDGSRVFSSSFACNNRTKSQSFFQNILKCCTFLSKISSIFHLSHFFFWNLNSCPLFFLVLRIQPSYFVECSKKINKTRNLIFCSFLTLLEFYLHLKTFFVIFSSYWFQMKQISTSNILPVTISNGITESTSWA